MAFRLLALAAAGILSIMCTSVLAAQVPTTVEHSDSAAGVVERFRHALRASDLETIRNLLDADATIVENGKIEGSREYMMHHLLQDIRSARLQPTVLVERHSARDSSVAWISSVYRAGQRLYDETMVLRRRNGSWTIVAVHWSH